MTPVKSILGFVHMRAKLMPGDGAATFSRDSGVAASRVGSRVHERGIIVREGERFILECGSGGRWTLEPDRVGEAHAGEIVTVRGVVVGDGLVAVNAIVSAAF